MSKEIYISSTPHETRLAIVEDDALTEIYYERENEYTLAGSIYNGKVTRVLPGMQSSFVDVGLERDAFLYITDFMEEAGDAADFESNANSGDHQRAPRLEGGRQEGGRQDGGRREERRETSDRGARGGRNDRDSREAAPRQSEPTDAELFSEAVSSLEPTRPVSSSETEERSGNRRGGRNRRDRNLNSDGTPRRDRAEGNAAEASRSASARPETPVQPIVSAPTPGGGDEVGEGAPGADGSRRWRGRRGRRGSRGPDGSAGFGTPREDGGRTPGTEEREPSVSTGPIFNSYGESPEKSYGDSTEESFGNSYREEGGLELDASAVAPPPPSASAPKEGAEKDRGDRERGDRDRGNRGGRGDRNRRDRDVQQPPRVPRGFTPSLGLYKVESAADEPLPGEPRPYGREAEDAAPITPLILPGESLGKYRVGGAETGEGSARKESSEPTPAASFTLAQAWDGGLVLPGETLRRRDPAVESRSSVSREQGSRESGSREQGSREQSGRSGRGGNGARFESRSSRPNPSERGASEASSDESIRQTIPQQGRAHEERSLEETFEKERSKEERFEPAGPLNSTFVAPPPIPTQVPTSLSPSEFEPGEGSASYRVDPHPPSEFRQSPPILETAAFAESSSEELPSEASQHLVPQHLVVSDSETGPADLHTVSADLRHALETASPQQPSHTPEHTGEDQGAAVGSQLTSISENGEMQSAPVEPALTHALPDSSLEREAAEPTAPIAHESAIVESSQGKQLFAPGSGLLEEEEIEEEEADFGSPLPSLQAGGSKSYGNQPEEAEQETLEGVADLGTMLREMSIDHITRTGAGVAEDEEESEEDFLEEDQDFDSEESDRPELLSGGEDSHESFEESSYEDTEEFKPAHSPNEGSGLSVAQADAALEPRREGQRDEPARREGRRGDRGRRSGSGDQGRGQERSGESGSDRSSSSNRERSPERSTSDRDRGRRDGRGGRQSGQNTNLPAISELLKPGQEILCQIAKEPIAKKGARITSHIALPGRFLVFMPTVNHTGVSRKIESDTERRRLKEILLSERGEASGGFIVRTAAAGASEEELRSDLRFLLNLWADIKQRSESSKSPALIYHDLNLVERVLRDQVTDTFSAIWVDTETEYERVLRFLQRFQPSLIRRVKLYTKETPLFEQFGITEEINKALRSKVWLKSGGSIVINQTEALVAIDINTGKFVGKTTRLEDTIVKTNLDAIPEIVRQIRLRDLGGIIIIDFIDMDERRNRNKVMAALEEELKLDRAPSKVLQFNDFGLVAITRKRVKQSLERTLSTTCGVCQGTGMVKSPVSVCNEIYIEMRKMHKHLDRGDVMLRVHPEVVKQLKLTTAKWLQEMEELVGKTILVKSDPNLHPEQFDIH